MSFSTTVKQELNRVSRDRACCRTAELAALFHSAGGFHIHGGDVFGLEAAFSLSATARSAVALVKSFQLPVEIRVREERRLRQGKRYEIYLEGGGHLVQFLNEIGVLSDRMHPAGSIPQRIIKRNCCRGAFLRGALLASGSVSEPGSPAHIEIYSDSGPFLDAVRQAAAGLGVELSLWHRERHPAVYSKNLSTLRDLLVITGAHQSALQFEERAVLASFRAEANRRANFDQANAARVSAAAARQVRAIKELKGSAAWGRLTPNLVEIAELRLKHPSATITELGRRTDPPLSKSAVNHRLRRLVRSAG
ncbi:MAG: DNA-binding protein WhiA [Actinobacteria bacterium]|nr:DNA-binding protein WhiA [Actinomycetota bacterium]